jgi:hypothetical protein
LAALHPGSTGIGNTGVIFIAGALKAKSSLISLKKKECGEQHLSPKH